MEAKDGCDQAQPGQSQPQSSSQPQSPYQPQSLSQSHDDQSQSHHAVHLNPAAQPFNPVQNLLGILNNQELTTIVGGASQALTLTPGNSTPINNPFSTPPSASQLHVDTPPTERAQRIQRNDTPQDELGRDQKKQPSAESGGIPTPTPKYLEMAGIPTFLLPRPRKILVVIDLNGTVLFRPKRDAPTKFVERPFTATFLKYMIETFKVVIWSSAKRFNVNKMCHQLLSASQMRNVVAIWSRDRFGLSQQDFNSRVVCYKRLTKLWDDPQIQAHHPLAQQGARWSQDDTVLIDDTFDKATSEPYNLVQVPEFKGDVQEPGYILPQVHDYVNVLANQTNVSSYIRETPFRADFNFDLFPEQNDM
ncbi:phosphoprotein phosphatase [Hypoxylon fuscum]|nr:phosphoprotein phosphatase [Hypoxylon fuscum]